MQGAGKRKRRTIRTRGGGVPGEGRARSCVGVCAGFAEKPLAQWDWEIQDRGSRTKLQVRLLPQRNREHRAQERRGRRGENSRKRHGAGSESKPRSKIGSA